MNQKQINKLFSTSNIEVVRIDSYLFGKIQRNQITNISNFSKEEKYVVFYGLNGLEKYTSKGFPYWKGFSVNSIYTGKLRSQTEKGSLYFRLNKDFISLNQIKKNDVLIGAVYLIYNKEELEEEALNEINTLELINKKEKWLRSQMNQTKKRNQIKQNLKGGFDE